MFAAIVNTLAIVAGSVIGLLLRRGLPKNATEAIMKGLGLVTVVIGLQGVMKEQDILLLIAATVLGVFWGETQDWEGRINRAAAKLTAKLRTGGDSAKMAEAFVTSCLIMNVGAMVIVGSLEAGLRQNYTILYTKSLLDFCAGIVMTSAMGIGVMFSAAVTFIVQGAIVLSAEYVAPYLSASFIDEMNAAGSLIILALGINMSGLGEFKALNYLPILLVMPLILALRNILTA